MKKGFTLIELLVVLVIIGILIALILPNTFSAIREANSKECASSLRAIDTAIQMCYARERVWANCAAVTNLVTNGYLQATPVCPFGKTYTIVDDSLKIGKESDKKTDHFPNWPTNFTHKP